MPLDRAFRSPAFLYLAALLILVLGTVFFALTVVQGTLTLSSAAVAAGLQYVLFPWIDGSPVLEPFYRLALPGVTLVDLSEKGTYILFFEHEEDGTDSGPDPEEIRDHLDISLDPVVSGRSIPVGPIRGKVTYALPGRKGEGIFQFQVDTPGAYTLNVRPAEGLPGGTWSLTVGFDVVRRVVKQVATGLAVQILSLFTAATVAGSTFFRQRRSRKQGSARPS